jgi:N-acetylglucosamine-6-phosphate deacetylase
MATAGSAIDGFTLNGRRITRQGGRLTLEDGTLAGADLDLTTALRNLVSLGVGLDAALAMATALPAQLIGQDGRLGALAPGRTADFLHLTPALTLGGVWRAGAAL